MDTGITREDAAILADPLAAGRPGGAEAHVRQVVRLLRGNGVSPCADAVAHVAALFDAIAAATPAPGIACAKGCGHCCHQSVSVTAPEAFAAARWVREAGLADAVLDADRHTRGMTNDQRWKSRIACPLLQEAACAIYPARPLSCRGMVSLSLPACIEAFGRLADVKISRPASYTALLSACRATLIAGLRLAGLDARGYELNGAVVAALAPGAEQRWRAGEDVFKGVDRDTSMPADFSAFINTIVAAVAATL